MRYTTCRLAIGVVATALALTACSSSTESSPPVTDDVVRATTTTAFTAYERPACSPASFKPAEAAPVEGSTSDFDLVSFDGATIRMHWFPRAVGKPSPTVLKGPGWSLPGDTDATSQGSGLFGDVNIKNLRDSGYNVLTWDPRGFGESGGKVNINSAEFEGRDVQRIIDWASAQPEVKLDAEGDPSFGMVGASYGGGIQFITAAIDCRVDAIVPAIAWKSLETSLYKNQTYKSGWGDALYNFGNTANLDPHIVASHDETAADGVLSKENQDWFRARGPGDLVDKITAPTLIVQGTVDTFFTLDEGVANYNALRAQGVPVAMLWYCGGHGVCLTPDGDPARNSTVAIDWLNRFVKGDKSVEVAVGIDVVDQTGAHIRAREFPGASGPTATASGRGTLKLIESGGAGPIDPATAAGVIGALAGGFTPAKASNSIDVDIAFATAAVVAGAPKLTARYRGSSPAGAKPTRVFAQLVDSATGLVLGNQITPIEVLLDGTEHEFSVALETVAFSAKAGSKLTLQIVATTVAYAKPRFGGSVEFVDIDVEVPTSTGFSQ